jgi:hypothetical protein
MVGIPRYRIPRVCMKMASLLGVALRDRSIKINIFTDGEVKISRQAQKQAQEQRKEKRKKKPPATGKP